MALVLLVSLFGCESRLPGPTECQKMAVALVGESPAEISKNPKKLRFVRIVTHGCLTIPFDHQAVGCVQETRRLPRCLEKLAWRVPTRKRSVDDFLQRALY